ncbi:MAG: helix-turn-helix domain-containing protein [Flavipsychrobacter sp.]
MEDAAFHSLIDEVVERLQEKHTPKGDKWISPEEAMQKLRITSKSTLQALRDQGKLRYSQPHKRYIVYDANSIDEYFEQHTKEKF